MSQLKNQRKSTAGILSKFKKHVMFTLVPRREGIAVTEALLWSEKTVL